MNRLRSAVETAACEIEAKMAGRAPGEPLPSIRRLAASLGLSKSTVVEAYDRLVAEGRVEARRGSGFYVGGRSAPRLAPPRGPALDREVDPLWVARQSLDSHERALRPGCGWLPADWMPDDALRRALRQLAKAPAPDLLGYAPPQGLPALRVTMARRLGEREVPAAPDQIVLCDSASQAIDLSLRALTRPGDVVMVDDPCYFNVLAMLRAHGLEIVGAPMTPAGPDLAAMAQILARARPRLYVTNCGPHNPTGGQLSPVAAHRLLQLAESADLAIVEDDVFADFEREPAPRLAAFDGLRRVVAVGGLSKTLSAAARCGYVAASRELAERLADLQIAVGFGGSALAQHVVALALQDGSWRKSVEALRERLARATPQVARRLEEAGLTLWTAPRAGLFLWARLPGGLSGAELSRRALAEGIVFAPGEVFSASGSCADFLRFNVAQSADARIFAFLRREIDAHMRHLESTAADRDRS